MREFCLTAMGVSLFLLPNASWNWFRLREADDAFVEFGFCFQTVCDVAFVDYCEDTRGGSLDPLSCDWPSFALCPVFGLYLAESNSSILVSVVVVWNCRLFLLNPRLSPMLVERPWPPFAFVLIGLSLTSDLLYAGRFLNYVSDRPRVCILIVLFFSLFIRITKAA